MAQTFTQMHRSTEGVLGGVCAGIAQRFDIDAALVRLLAILLTIATVGAFGLVYLAAWLVLPAAPAQGSAVDIDPESFKSEVYEQVVNRPRTRTTESTASAAYMPPLPPSAASNYYAAHASMPSTFGVASSSASDYAAAQSERPIAMGLILGGLLIAVGAAALFSSISNKFAVIQFWPLLFVVAGIIRIVIPAKDGTRSVTTWIGVLSLLVGAGALATTLGYYTIDVDAWVSRAFPFLIVAVGLFIMGRASHTNILIVLAGIAIVIFLCIGMFFSFRDSVSEVGVSLPFTPQTMLEQNEGQ